MKPIILIISFIYLFSSCTIENNTPETVGLQAGDMLPLFSISNSRGEIVSNYSCIGKVSVIVFINSECSDCQESLPIIQKVYDMFCENNDCLFAVIARGETEEKAQRWLENQGYTFPVFGDNKGEIYSLFAVTGIPRIYLSGKRGYISTIKIKNIYEKRLIRNITYLLNN